MPGFTGGEDPEMCFAILLAGYKLWYEPDLKYKHQIPSTRLTKKFIYDTTQNVQVVQPYLRLFMSYLISKNGPEIEQKLSFGRTGIFTFYTLF